MDRSAPDQSNRSNVRKLYEAGLTVRQIARTLDLSTQRVYQLLEALELPPPSQKEGAA